MEYFIKLNIKIYTELLKYDLLFLHYNEVI